MFIHVNMMTLIMSMFCCSHLFCCVYINKTVFRFYGIACFLHGKPICRWWYVTRSQVVKHSVQCIYNPSEGANGGLLDFNQSCSLRGQFDKLLQDEWNDLTTSFCAKTSHNRLLNPQCRMHKNSPCGKRTLMPGFSLLSLRLKAQLEPPKMIKISLQ